MNGLHSRKNSLKNIILSLVYWRISMKKIIKKNTPIKKSDTKEKAKKRVAAYARVSTEQDEQLHSLQVQRDYYEEWKTY